MEKLTTVPAPSDPACPTCAEQDALCGACLLAEGTTLWQEWLDDQEQAAVRALLAGGLLTAAA